MSVDVCDDPYKYELLDVSNLPVLITVGQVNPSNAGKLVIVFVDLDQWCSYSRYDHQRRFRDISKVRFFDDLLNLTTNVFRITYGIKPSGSIVYMNKDGGGSLDLLNIRSMAKVDFIEERLNDVFVFFSMIDCE